MTCVYHTNKHLSELIFSENLQVHLRNINAKLDKTISILKKEALLSKKNTVDAYKFARKNIINIKMVKNVLNFFFKGTPIAELHAMFVAPYIKKAMIINQLAKIGYTAVKDYKSHYDVLHLKNVGHTPVIISIGASAFYNSNGKHKNLNSNLDAIINSNTKRGGILILNSASGFNKCNKIASKYAKQKICISAGNGAFVSISDGKGGQIILQDKKIPKEPAKDLYNYFKREDKKDLLSNYYMVIETSDGEPCIIDIANGKEKYAKGKYQKGEVNFEYALAHASSIRFMLKTKNMNKQQILANCKTYDQKVQSYNNYFNTKAGEMIETLSFLPPELRKSINENMDIQLGKNGSVCLVPKGCSKIKSAKMIAEAYNLPENQILNIATTISDVCEPVSLETFTNYFAQGGQTQNCVNACFKLNENSIKDANRLVVANNYMGTVDSFNLNNKINNDLIKINKDLFDKKAQKERVEFEIKQKEILDTIIEECKKEAKEIEDDDNTAEKREKLVNINNRAKQAYETYQSMLVQFENNLATQKVDEIYSKYNYNISHYTSVVNKIKNLSNQIPETKTVQNDEISNVK